MKPTRREVLGTGIAAALGTAGSAGAVVLYEKPDEDGGKIASRLKLSCAAYSFRDFLPSGKSKGTMTLHDFFDLAAGWGLDGVEPTSYYFSSEEKAYLHSLKAHAFKLGLDISGTAIRNNFCLPAGEKRDTEIAHVKKWIDHSVEFGAPVIRIFAGNKNAKASPKQDFAWTIECMKECCDYAGTRGVFLAIENHGYLTGTGAELLQITDAVDHEWFGINLDTGNFVEKPYENMAMCASKAINVQVKVELRTADGKGREPADYGRIVGILREVNYRGYVALEYEAKEDPKVAVPRHIDALREACRA